MVPPLVWPIDGQALCPVLEGRGISPENDISIVTFFWMDGLYNRAWSDRPQGAAGENKKGPDRLRAERRWPA